MESHHPIMSHLRDLGGQTYRQTETDRFFHDAESFLFFFMSFPHATGMLLLFTQLTMYTLTSNIIFKLFKRCALTFSYGGQLSTPYYEDH